MVRLNGAICSVFPRFLRKLQLFGETLILGGGHDFQTFTNLEFGKQFIWICWNIPVDTNVRVCLLALIPMKNLPKLNLYFYRNFHRIHWNCSLYSAIIIQYHFDLVWFDGTVSRWIIYKYRYTFPQFGKLNKCWCRDLCRLQIVQQPLLNYNIHSASH